ncbi:MAG: DUF1499 domain-containing protein [Pseudomonadota bacterium]
MMDSVDFRQLKRPASPNTYLLAPEGFCETCEIDDVSPIFPVDTATLYCLISSVVDAEPSWRVKTADADRGLMHIVATSALLRFKDDVHIYVVSAEAGAAESAAASQLAIYSRSRVGYSDLGANKKRVRQLLDRLKDVHVAT